MDDHKESLTDVRVLTQWHTRFIQQFRALFWKNVLLSWRNWKATTVRLLAPLIFLLLVWLIDKALQENERQLEETKVRRQPRTDLINNIPPCEDDLYIRGDCWSFLYTVTATGDVTPGEANETVAEIVNFIREHNDPVIRQEDVLYMESRDEVNRWFLNFTEKALGAVHFEVSNGQRWIDFTLQTNSTIKYFKNDFQDPNFFFQLPMQNAVQRAIAVHQLRSSGAIGAEEDIEWTMGHKDYPHPAFDTDTVAGALLGPFLFAANMFGVVTQMNAMVSEKQGGMKQALRTMGMLDSAYWTSWAAWEFALNFFTSLLNYAFGCLFQFKFFLDNDFFLIFLMLFLFQVSMVGIGFLVAALVNKVVVATMFGFVIFVGGWMTFTVQQFGIPYTSEYFDDLWYLTVIFTAMPWNIFMKGVQDLGSATANSESDGLKFSQRFSYCKDEDGDDICENEAAVSDDYIDCECVMPVGHIYWILLVLTLGYIAIAVYIDKVVPNEFGVRLHPFYLLDPRYWGFKTKWLSGMTFRTLERTDDVEREIDADVQAECEKMKEYMDPDGVPITGGRPVELFTLQKRFGGKFFAIQGSSFAIDEGELFCLLGPNGAGKTTTINCLTGVLPPSGGAAFVYGHSITEPGGMDRIRSMMGVCPQFDVLWKNLSGMEHLWIFGLVKGIPGADIFKESSALLEKVALTHAAAQKAGTYSGGMKRRLSVAIALLGDPKVVFLDEPTTGMDPISRRYVWDIIESAKSGRAIVLTTHSMEEADILGDRISIMARGDVRALGSSIRLKQKFGAGYSISVSAKGGSSSQMNNKNDNGNTKEIKAFFMEALGIHPREENKAYTTFLIPRDKEKTLRHFLEELEKRQEDLGIGDIHLSLTTLEEVFLNIARTAEIEALKAGGVSDTEVPFTDGTRVMIELGQETFVHPVSNVSYVVHWGQTDSGTLQITDAVPIGEVPSEAPDPNLSLLN